MIAQHEIFHSNISNRTSYDTLNTLELGLPKFPFKRMQSEPNAPLTSFSPEVEAIGINNINVEVEAKTAAIDTKNRIETKALRLSAFRRQLCRRVQERLGRAQEQKQQQELLRDQKEQKLMTNAKATSKANNGEASDKQIRVDEVIRLRLGNFATNAKTRKSPFTERLQEISTMKTSMRMTLLRHKAKSSNKSADETPSETSSTDDSEALAKKASRFYSEMKTVDFSPHQRAKLVASVRRSYMVVERTRVQAHSAKQAIKATSKSPKKEVGPSKPTDPLKARSSTGVFIVDLSNTIPSAVKQPGATGSAQKPKLKKGFMKPTKSTSKENALRKSTTKKSVPAPTTKPNVPPKKVPNTKKLKKTHSPKKRHTNSISQESERYITALQEKVAAKTALCGCPHSKKSSESRKIEAGWTQCANNCSFYQNPRQVERLLVSSVAQSQAASPAPLS